MLAVLFPVRTDLFITSLIGVVKFDLIDLTDYAQSFLDLDDEEPLNPYLDTLDYGGTSFAINTANILLFAGIILAQAILGLLCKFCGERGRQTSKSISKKLYCNGIILFLQEISVEFFITAFI